MYAMHADSGIPEKEMNACPNCGHILSDVDNFCPNCGRSRNERNSYPTGHLLAFLLLGIPGLLMGGCGVYFTDLTVRSPGGVIAPVLVLTLGSAIVGIGLFTITLRAFVRELYK